MGFAAQTLRAARERAGLTQIELAAQTGTSQATISAYESAAKEPTVATLTRLLAATGMRLRAEPAPHGVVSAAELRRRGRVLRDVLDLAASLPSRHDPELRYPVLKRAP